MASISGWCLGDIVWVVRTASSLTILHHDEMALSLTLDRLARARLQKLETAATTKSCLNFEPSIAPHALYLLLLPML